MASHTRTILNPPASALHPPAPTYSHIASYPISTTHKLVTIAGQCGIHPDGTIAEGFEAQMTLALQNLDTCMQHAGVSKDEIMRLGIYIVGEGPEEGRERVRKGVLGRWLCGEGGKAPPPDTLLYVTSLAVRELLFEVDCLAVGRI